MKQFPLLPFMLFAFPFSLLAQNNVGVGTTNPQAKLHVNGTFKLQNGVIVNGISNDTTFNPGSDSLLITQLAVKRFLWNGSAIPPFQLLDTTFEGTQTFSMYPDSMVYASPDGWQSDSALNVFTIQGNVGIGVNNPTAELEINGDEKIEGAHTLTLGSGLPDWEQNAAKFGYSMITPNALDMVGAGPAGNKKIKFWNEGYSWITGKFHLADTAQLSGARFDNYVRSAEKVGIGVTNPTDELTVNGSTRISGGLFGGRIGMNGSMGAYNLTILRDGPCWNDSDWPAYLKVGLLRIVHNGDIVDMSDSNSPVSQPKEYGLNVRGSTLVTDSLSALHGFKAGDHVKIFGTHVFETGAFIPGKEVNAGKIGYQVFTSNALDIVGAGTSNTNRKIKMWAENQVIAVGNVTINGSLQASAVYSEPWTELAGQMQNNWVNFGSGFSTIAMYKDREGVVHLKGLIKNGLNQQNTVIVNLPAGYRPMNGNQIFEVVNGVDTFGRIDVETDGDVVFRGITNTFISLDQIKFKTN